MVEIAFSAKTEHRKEMHFSTWKTGMFSDNNPFTSFGIHFWPFVYNLFFARAKQKVFEN